ncbi:calcium-binding protein [Stenotrophomonas sp. YIM B06876]|uniref:calcium-binding protein n=1 Tax=Stenotrophomonas sp. YIM B06876 TaxID=3060211 RepID=UPI0027399743|nr:calcium-binding protein [Stenotrophomonas sp. YIM B06876]
MKRWLWMAAVAVSMAWGAAHAASAEAGDDTAAQIVTHAGDHRLLVLGEYHGTVETPLLVAGLMERYSRDNAAVRLALEMPTSENAALARYLRSEGDAPARKALRQSPFWRVRDNQHDGRRSRDMLGLIEAVRSLREQGRDVSVAGYDREAAAEGGNDVRDAWMAACLRQQFGALPPAARMLVVTGNVHAMRQRPADAPAQMQQRPMASHLLDLPLYSVRLEALQGEFWGCGQPCRAIALYPTAARAPDADTTPGRQYDLVIWMPRLSVARLTD